MKAQNTRNNSNSGGKYQNLSNDFTTLGKFVYIYEKEIKFFNKQEAFQNKFKEAFYLFKKKLRKKIRYAKISEIHEYVQNQGQISFVFTKRNAQVLDLCRHFRNSFCHAILKKEKNQMWITDKYKGNLTADGFLDYNDLMEFIISIVKNY